MGRGECRHNGFNNSGYGKVYKALDTRRHALVAVKKIQLSCDPKLLEKELLPLRALSSPYIVRYYDAFYTSDDLCVASCV